MLRCCSCTDKRCPRATRAEIMWFVIRPICYVNKRLFVSRVILGCFSFHICETKLLVQRDVVKRSRKNFLPEQCNSSCLVGIDNGTYLSATVNAKSI